MFKRSIVYMIVLIVLTGCSAQTGEKDLMSTIEKIEQGIKEKDVLELKVQANKVKELYKKNDWKIHLIGDEGEYERLNESINRLIAAIEAEELTDAKIELATLKTIVHDIYSL